MNPLKSPFKWIVSGFSGKTSWDWLELLIIPVFLAIGAYSLENQAEGRQAKIAATRSQQETLDNYLEKMQGLLLDRNLRSAKEESEVRSVARAITTTAIRELNGDRNALLISFLQESSLIQKTENLEEKTIALLVALDLSRASLSRASLSRANLGSADLGSADLSGAFLGSADLSNAFLFNADLSNADLSDANLSRASLISADLSDANGLTRGQLKTALLCETQLREGIDLDPNRDCERLLNM